MDKTDFELIEGGIEKKLDDLDRPEYWMSLYMLSEEEVQDMLDAEFIIPDLVISAHITVIAALAGRGKTSIAMHECANMVNAGYRVMYVNMDCGAGDIKFWYEHAQQGGFKMITPHFKGGRGVMDWMEGLEAMSNSRRDLTGLVIVVDTLKKIADLLHKSQVRHTFNILRALTALGATVICLAHCNKHRDPNGDLVFEGTGDVMNDCDDLLYLESEKDDAGVRTVSTVPTDKVRGVFHPRSWKIHEDRTVEALEGFVDVAAKIEAQAQLEKDATVIEIIQTGITASHRKRVELFEYTCTDHKISRREFDAVLRRYCEGYTGAKVAPIWRNEKQSKENADYYILLSEQ
jgi:hypothetical protein